MIDPEGRLDELFEELVGTKPEPRVELNERARRSRITSAIHARLAEPRIVPTRGAARATPRRMLLLMNAAAIVLVVFGAFRWLHRPSTPLLEPESRERPGSERSRPPPTLPPAALPPNSRDVPRSTEEVHRVAPAPRAEPAARVPKAPEGGTVTADDAASASASQDPEAASLGAQVELFQAAVRAARRGDDESALAHFDEFLRRSPTSPLAPDARVRKFRTLSRLGRTEDARAAASEYLERHPQGFARNEAEQLLRPAASVTKPPGP